MRRLTARTGFWVTLTALGFVAVPHAPNARGAPPEGPRGAASVSIKNFDFTPEVVTITTGGAVRWVNADVATHQITTGVVEADRPRPDGRISSRLLVRGDDFTAAFPAPGAYPYYCGVHPFMRGTVVVK